MPAGVRTEGSGSSLPESLNRNLLLVEREAIGNSVAHAGPARTEVHLSLAPAQLSLEIRDDGCGFPVDRPEFSSTDHFGITGMRERVEQPGGLFSLSGAPGQGTSVTAILPLAPVGVIAV